MCCASSALARSPLPPRPSAGRQRVHCPRSAVTHAHLLHLVRMHGELALRVEHVPTRRMLSPQPRSWHAVERQPAARARARTRRPERAASPTPLVVVHHATTAAQRAVRLGCSQSVVNEPRAGDRVRAHRAQDSRGKLRDAPAVGGEHVLQRPPRLGIPIRVRWVEFLLRRSLCHHTTIACCGGHTRTITRAGSKRTIASCRRLLSFPTR